ncbi:hypothetical protein ACEPAF_3008 [Sanghuangporus sanghuang]
MKKSEGFNPPDDVTRAKGADRLFRTHLCYFLPRSVWWTTTVRIRECRAQPYRDRSLSKYRWWRSELRSFHNSLDESARKLFPFPDSGRLPYTCRTEENELVHTR